MKSASSRKKLGATSVDDIFRAARRWARSVPEAILLRHGRALQTILLLLGLAVAVGAASWLLFTQPSAEQVVLEPGTVTLETEKIDTITTEMESRLRSRETGLVIPRRTIFHQSSPVEVSD